MVCLMFQQCGGGTGTKQSTACRSRQLYQIYVYIWDSLHRFQNWNCTHTHTKKKKSPPISAERRSLISELNWLVLILMLSPWICLSLIRLLINSDLDFSIWMAYSHPYGFYRGQTSMWFLHSSNCQGNWIKRLLWFWSRFILQPFLLLSVRALSVSVSLAICEVALCCL